MPKEKENMKTLTRILMILGAIFLVLIGLFYIFGVGFLTMLSFQGFAIGAIFSGIVLILIGVIILSSYGLLEINLKFEQNWLINLILGIIAFIFGGGIGALLVIVAAIIDLISETM
ncbi:MAG: hypothetical protein ACP6IP_10590 [Candidatus Njordarchaeia archaeon]